MSWEENGGGVFFSLGPFLTLQLFMALWIHRVNTAVRALTNPVTISASRMSYKCQETWVAMKKVMYIAPPSEVNAATKLLLSLEEELHTM